MNLIERIEPVERIERVLSVLNQPKSNTNQIAGANNFLVDDSLVLWSSPNLLIDMYLYTLNFSWLYNIILYLFRASSGIADPERRGKRSSSQTITYHYPSYVLFGPLNTDNFLFYNECVTNTPYSLGSSRP